MTKAHVPIDRRFAKPNEEQLKDYDYQRHLGSLYSEQTSGWADILKCKRAVILGEGRSGKTHEFKQQSELLRSQGLVSIFIPLERLHDSSVEDAVSPLDEKALNNWLDIDSDDPAWFFLDAVDELKLRDGSFRKALRKLGRRIEGKSSSARLVVSCRPADWRHQIDATDFQELFPIALEKEVVASPSPTTYFRSTLTRDEVQDQNQETENPSIKDEVLAFYALLPLTPTQVVEFAEAVDPSISKGFREQIDKTETWPLFQTPSDIIDGIALIRTKGRLGSLEEQKSAGIAMKLAERPDRPGKPSLSDTRALDGAERLALSLALTKRRTLHIDRSEQSETALCVGDVLTDWPGSEQQELLSRPLFDPSGVNAVRFHHRSTAEFLAAKRLSHKLKQGLPWYDLKPLLFSDLWGERVIRPYLEPIAAWLALWHPEILSEVRDRKPQILFQQGFPYSMPISLREDLVRSFVEKYQASDWRSVGVSINDVARLGHTDLATIIRELWDQATTGYDTLELLLELILFTPIPDCVDLALEVALDDGAEYQHRVYAARIVLELGTKLNKQSLGEEILNGEWGNDLIRNLIPYLLPDAVDLPSFVELACRTEELPSTVHGLNYSLYNVLKKPQLSPVVVRELTHALAVSVWDNRHENAKSYQARSKYDHFVDAILSGCAREAALPTDQLSDDWVWDAMIALHFGERKQSIIAKDETKVIIDRLADDRVLRPSFYWATLAFAIELDREKDAWSRYHTTDRERCLGGISEPDFPWLFEAMEDHARPYRRGVAFFAVMLCWQRSEHDMIVAKRVRSTIADLPELVAEYDRFINPPKTSPHEKYERESAKRTLKRERKEAARLAQWEKWRQTLEADPVGAFQGEAKERNVYDVFNWMGLATRNFTSWGGWSEEILDQTFSEALINQLRPALSEYWRKDSTKTWSEKDAKNETSSRSVDALSALKSEAAVEGWAEKLTIEEAQLATKLSMVELNGFASLISQLASVHPTSVASVITNELEEQIKVLSITEKVPLLQDLHHLEVPALKMIIARWLLDKVGLWPDALSDGAHEALVRAMDLVAGYTETDERSDLERTIQKRLQKYSRLTVEYAGWLRAFAILEPKTGCECLVETLREFESPAEIEYGYTLFGKIFGDREYAGSKPDLDAIPDGERSTLVANLLNCAYRVAHPTTDIKHTGVHSPGHRDYAETARRYLFDCLIELKCTETHHALARFSTLPEFDHMKSRLLEMKTELAASASEPDAMPIEYVNRFDLNGSLTPANTEMLHQTMLNRLADYEHFLLHSEFSNRGTLRLVEQETELRRNIANWLNDHSRGVYRVNQEAVKVNENRTDIRLNATAVDLETAIELKLDDGTHRWSGADLEHALRDQLVGKYLSHERCRSGCLLIVQREQRRWKHPNSGKMMQFNELLTWLQELADAISAEKPEIMVNVLGIDLTTA